MEKLDKILGLTQEEPLRLKNNYQNQLRLN